MITGAVSVQREAKIPLQVRGQNGQPLDIEEVLDTGFTGYLTLPAATIGTLGLSLRGTRDAILGDGSRVMLDIYRGAVIWDGQVRDVQALAAEGDILVEMSLLYGYDVHVRVLDGGEVTIIKIP